MKISKRTAFVLVFMILVSFLFANIFSTLSINPDLIVKENHQDIGDQDKNLIWFVQISDIHISIFKDPQRITQFRDFCSHTLDAIKPIVVLATGDLTDAKTKDSVGSMQFQEEWEYYRDILKETQIQDKTLWLDIRGNHDSFNVANAQSKQNYFANYSIQGKLHPRSYMYQIEKSNVTYSFVAIDACLEPGPKRPFNFVGILSEQEIELIEQMIQRLKSSGSNYTIWFGHFPTSCILTYGKENVRDIIGKDKNGLAYLCGHLHKMGGLVPHMYTLQNAGFLELELGDWKDNRMYRVLAIDHGILSFTDVEIDDWPVILVTNPKHALFVNPLRENLENMRNSRFIRILAFSLSAIVSVEVKIDQSAWKYCKSVSEPLYVCHFDSNYYLEGLHEIQVSVKDAMGRTKTIKQEFSLDGTRLNFNLLPRFLLSTNANILFRVMFASMVLASILPLICIRYLHQLVEVGKFCRPRQCHNLSKIWLRKIWVLSTTDRLFWPMILYPIYLCFGPWSIGYLVDDHIGVVFSWGIYVGGTFLPGSFTYAYGFVQLITFQLPLTLMLAHGVDQSFQYHIFKPKRKLSIMDRISVNLPFGILLIIQLEMAYLFWLAYGTLAFVLGPLRTWSIFLAAVLWYHAVTLPADCTRKTAAIWNPPPKEGCDVSTSCVEK